jgi:hypothetical protein
MARPDAGKEWLSCSKVCTIGRQPFFDEEVQKDKPRGREEYHSISSFVDSREPNAERFSIH